MKKIKWIITSLLLLAVWMIPNSSMTTLAAGDPMIVVSLGDSFSSGESIEPFYGQDKNISERIQDHDWLAHRSKIGWPALLEIPGYPGTMSDYRQTEKSTANCQWYFAASSGAVSSNIYATTQNKSACKKVYLGTALSPSTAYYYCTSSVDLPRQLDIFDQIEGNVDYVTLSIGGNDVGFADIVSTCALKSTYLGSTKIEEQLTELWNDIDYIKMCLENTYDAITIKAGPQATILVAGYPKLFNARGWLISEKEANKVNENVSKFNQFISDLIDSCRNEGMNIYFVGVEDAFDANGGHAAYSKDPWINKIILGTKSQDLDDTALYSAYSVHPNSKGAQAYAACVNAKIAEIEANKKIGTLSGKICTAADRTTPVQYTTINAFRDGETYAYRESGDTAGNYSIEMQEGEYKVVIDAIGYLPFTAYATVNEDENTYMETFLLVEGEEGETGVAQGMITNALTGWGIPEVNLEVREGWNNTTNGDVITTAQTNASGNYSLTLPLGNYCLTASKDGYITGTVNIIVQRGTTKYQSGSITPILSGDDYRVVLTWGANPRDLDSHMVGRLSTGNSFHVYYGHKSQYDNSEEICNLDVDDTSGYGPETITLKATSAQPYYYYIYHYSGSGNVASSEATIKLYQGNELVAKLNVPTDQGSGRYWNVFAIVDGQLVIKNTISGRADTSYANSPVATYSLRAANFAAVDAENEVSDMPKKSEETCEETDTSVDSSKEDSAETDASAESSEETSPETDASVESSEETSAETGTSAESSEEISEEASEEIPAA